VHFGTDKREKMKVENLKELKEMLEQGFVGWWRD
jgi:hypothetical protein